MGPLVQVAELLQEFVVRLPELEPVQSVPRVGRQLNRRDLRDTFCHGPAFAPIVLCVNIELWVVNPHFTLLSVYARMTVRKREGTPKVGRHSLDFRRRFGVVSMCTLWRLPDEAQEARWVPRVGRFDRAETTGGP